MPYLIDGHNLIPKIPGLNLRKIDDEIALIELLQGFCQRTGKQVEVYFDNAPAGSVGKRKYGTVTAHFVRAGTTADTAIRLRLGQLKGAAKNWIVVSSDRQVQAEARGARAQILASEGFAQELGKISPPTPTGKPEKKLTPDEVEEWLALFGDTRDKNRFT
ncbi:MAG TPA: NYN domain-containing protein [Anaerolineales bacterium]|nr:NYN domain-containing protein [Anaerolineales bacterium]